MEDISGLVRDDEQIELPPGFRFHPTDEELITHYLSPKVLDFRFDAIAIGVVDLNKVEPWELPWKAKMGEKEWYFFCVRDRKYPTGLRTNRATDAGYWKATGKDKEIYRGKTLVGMKKTLVFYKGRAPKGEKSNWVMHEYRIEGKCSTNYLPKPSKNEWVICRIFHKSADGKKIPFSGLNNFTNNVINNKLTNSHLPQLLDISPFDCPITGEGETSHVTCFSGPTEQIKPHDHNLEKKINNITNSLLTSSSSSSSKPNVAISSSLSLQSTSFSTPLVSYSGNIQYPGSIWRQDQSLLRLLIENNNNNNELKNYKGELGHESGFCGEKDLGQCYEDEEYPYASNEVVDLDCLWNY